MAEEEESQPRWRCEACGCHTNTEASNSVSCGVCGTRRAPTSLLRRDPVLRGGFGSGGPSDDDQEEEEEEEQIYDMDGEFDNEDDGEDDGDVRAGDGVANDAAAAALDAAGIADAAMSPRSRASRRLGAAAFSLFLGDGGGRNSRRTSDGGRNAQPPRRDAAALLAVATENAHQYQPQWVPTNENQRSGRDSSILSEEGNRNGNDGAGNEIVVDVERHPQVAFLPEGGGEGRAVRATPHIPRVSPTSPAVQPPMQPGAGGGADSSTAGRQSNRLYGFRVAFHNPNRADGRSMGGCYLVGVTTTASAASLAERSWLTQSRFFWGIEDGGRRYEGGSTSSSVRRRGLASSGRDGGGRHDDGIAAASQPPSRASRGTVEAPRNADSVLFGSREVITVVVDVDARSLTYWRDGILLGPLVHNLPKTQNLYPVAVPFNAGVSVAITGLNGDPRAVLERFQDIQRQARQEKERRRRVALVEQRLMLIRDGQPTPRLIEILGEIFSWYQRTDGMSSSEGKSAEVPELGSIGSARLWYRCGLKLSHLQKLAEEKPDSQDGTLSICLRDFIGVIERIIREDEEMLSRSGDSANSSAPDAMVIVGSGSPPATSNFRVGDKVEVTEGYERYGDAASGPLRPGDRGTIIDVQRGPRGNRGESQSVRVVYNGRRWWYQPQALVSERSGLIESPAVRFLRTLLRSHGFDHTTLTPMWGKVVTNDSWQPGDLVAPLQSSTGSSKNAQEMVGRVVTDSSSSSPKGRDTGYVPVEFASPDFAKATGLIGGPVPGSSGGLAVATRRAKVSNLVHTTFFHAGSLLFRGSDSEELDGESGASQDTKEVVESETVEGVEGSELRDEARDVEDMATDEPCPAPLVVDEGLKSKIANIARLDNTSIAAVTKELGRSSSSLAGMFGAGLPDAIISGVDRANELVSGSGWKEGNGSAIDSSTISALGALSVSIAKHLFAKEDSTKTKRDYKEEKVRSEGGLNDALVDVSLGEGPTFSERTDAMVQRSVAPDEPTNRTVDGGTDQSRARVDVRELLRDLGGAGASAERRRSLLLNLMASARMSDESPSAARVVSAPTRDADIRQLGSMAQQLRGRQIISSLSRLSADSLAIGYGLGRPQLYGRHPGLGQPLDLIAPPHFDGDPSRRGLPLPAVGGTAPGRHFSNPSDGSSPMPEGQPIESSSRGTHRGSESTSSFLESVMRDGVSSVSTSGRASVGSLRPVSPALKSLIHNGLALNSAAWVEKSLGKGGGNTRTSNNPVAVDVPTAHDEDGTPVLSLAVCLGCSTSILQALIGAGARVGERELRNAAESNQPHSVSLLLRYTVYTEGAFDISRCSTAVRQKLDKAAEEQRHREERMRRDAGDFAARLLRGLLRLGLHCRLRCRTQSTQRSWESCAKAVAHTLVGDVLLHAMHVKQQEAIKSAKAKLGDDSMDLLTATTHPGSDGRMPAFTVGTSAPTAPGGSSHTDRATLDDVLSVGSTLYAPLSLLNVLPREVVRRSLDHDVGDENMSSGDSSLMDVHDATHPTTVYMCLMESYLWSKEVREAATGLTFARILLSTAPMICGEHFERYGVLELAQAHAECADDSIAEIQKRIRSKSEDKEDVSSVNPGVVRCPKKHTTILHLTRHSSFRCDLCGKGVDQGQPMHGCRECDWDACEKCTSRAEGGLVKWGHIAKLAADCQQLMRQEDKAQDTGGDAPFESSKIHGQEDVEGELQRISNGIAAGSIDAINTLASLLAFPGQMTLYEFALLILPPLHRSLTAEWRGNRKTDNRSESVDIETTQLSIRRRFKRARVGGFTKRIDAVPAEGELERAHKGMKQTPLTDRRSFLRAVVSTLIVSACKEKEENESDNGEGQKGTDGDAQMTDVPVNDDDDDDGEDGSEEPSSSVANEKKKEEKSVSFAVPEVINRIHALLSYSERVPVFYTFSESPGGDNSGGKNGELETLTLPFEVELMPSSSMREGNSTTPQQLELAVPATSRKSQEALTVHVEPLMSMAALEMHVLRTCRFQSHDYLQYCRRLVADQAIIAERVFDPSTSKKSPAKAGSKNHEVARRIARVVAFNETTGGHKVRYASGFLGLGNSFPEQSSGSDISGVGNAARPDFWDGLEFLGGEHMMILATRDYLVINRDKPILTGGSHSFGGPDEERKLSSGNATLADGSTGMETARNSSGVLEAALPLGARVESDVASEDSCAIYTVLAASKDRDTDTDIQDDVANPIRYDLVSDLGEVFLSVPSSRIKGHDVAAQRHVHQQSIARVLNSQSHQRDRSRDGMGTFPGHQNTFERRSLPSFRRSRAGGSETSGGSEGQAEVSSVGVLKRTWSALSPVQEMSPLDLTVGSSRSADIERGRTDNKGQKLKVQIGKKEMEIYFSETSLERPPAISVDFSISENMTPMHLPGSDERTVFSALQRMSSSNKADLRVGEHIRDRRCTLYYAVVIQNETRAVSAVASKPSSPFFQEQILPTRFQPPWARQSHWHERRRKPSSHNDCFDIFGVGQPVLALPPHDTQSSTYHSSTLSATANESSSNLTSKTLWGTDGIRGSDGEDSLRRNFSLCEGLNGLSVMCMEVLSVLAESLPEVYHEASRKDGNIPSEETEKRELAALLRHFESEALNKKLLEQLEDPLTVVGGALPTWCTAAPTFAPQIFSHACRRLLMERAAFGVSRAALRQQEAKVAVGPLRQRMAALRGRAVELVGEAFSGGAADPTALQLQADELYGMEEALSARVNAAFRAQRWSERSLQCAKAAVRRDALLRDADEVMERYATDPSVNRRRLEIRFEGESGFDAASGDEAGVTRGFYADVAEALLSSDTVAGILCSSACPKVSGPNETDFDMLPAENSGSSSDFNDKLPLWIPDMDSSLKVVIPTPRADSHSGLGVYPRPISVHHPSFHDVVERFRLMGRLFAASLRDGFVFPLPLSASFLKLVQNGSRSEGLDQNQGETPDPPMCQSSSVASGDTMSLNSSPLPGSSMYTPPSADELNGAMSFTEYMNNLGEGSSDSFFASEHRIPASHMNRVRCGLRERSLLEWSIPLRHGFALSSLDLPRPGFLGGEVYAVEKTICVELDALDKITMSQEEKDKRMRQLSSDKTFASRALGKSYDCSFEDYFADKRFVDPLDPTQGEDAVQLCANGHLKSVNISNIREWVELAKRFILYDGVIHQALAFRSGVDDFFSADALWLFTAEELQRDVCGGGDNVERWTEEDVRALFKLDGGKGAAEALVAVAAIGGEGGAALSRRFGPSSPTISHLVKALLESSANQRRQFLSFVTSVPIVTPGQIEVVPIVNPAGEFLSMSDPACLPRANTCARRLYLPKFESYESFQQVLWAVVREECRFKGFFEWRG